MVIAGAVLAPASINRDNDRAVYNLQIIFGK